MRYFCSLFFIVFAALCANAKHALSRRAAHAPVTVSESNIPPAKIRPSAYSGILKLTRSFLLLRPNYEYCITDKKGNTVAFIDTSELVTGTPLLNLSGKEITVTGQTFPHKYRGVIVVKAQSIVTSNSQP